MEINRFFNTFAPKYLVRSYYKLGSEVGKVGALIAFTSTARRLQRYFDDFVDDFIVGCPTLRQNQSYFRLRFSHFRHPREWNGE